jgi:hypothetical protein
VFWHADVCGLDQVSGRTVHRGVNFDQRQLHCICLRLSRHHTVSLLAGENWGLALWFVRQQVGLAIPTLVKRSRILCIVVVASCFDPNQVIVRIDVCLRQWSWFKQHRWSMGACDTFTIILACVSMVEAGTLPHLTSAVVTAMPKAAKILTVAAPCRPSQSRLFLLSIAVLPCDKPGLSMHKQSMQIGEAECLQLAFVELCDCHLAHIVGMC